LSKRYSVKPLASTSTLPSGVVATLTVAAAAETVVVVCATVVVDAVEAVEFEGLEVLLLLPHAASAKAVTANVASTRTWKWRMEPRGQRFGPPNLKEYGRSARVVR
jgi:hypothetical protein